MNELIKIENKEVGNETIQTASARELHKFLEVTERFSSWMERQFQYGFEEGVDYLGCKVFNTQANQELQDYYLSLDCAKEIAMLQKSDKGREARRYFIECEKQLKQAVSPKQKFLLNILEADDELSRAVAINQYEVGYVKPLENKVVEQEGELYIVRPKGDYFDLLVDRNLLTSFRDTAKEFCIGQKVFINFLIENKYIFRDSKGKLKPYQVHIDTGLFQLKEFVNGGYTDVQTLVTPKGRETFRLLLELMLTNT